MFETPYAQVMLEWDSAAYNDFVKEHNRAMAQLKHSISTLKDGKSPDAIRERARLRNLAVEYELDFKERAQRFWFGEEEEE